MMVQGYTGFHYIKTPFGSSEDFIGHMCQRMSGLPTVSLSDIEILCKNIYIQFEEDIEIIFCLFLFCLFSYVSFHM